MFIQPKSKYKEEELAQSLVAWLDRSRVPAIFKDDEPWSGSACRQRLRQYAESWIEAGYRLDRWKWRDSFAALIQSARVKIEQPSHLQVSTTISFEASTAADAERARAEWDEYQPPRDDLTEEEEEREQEERDEQNALIAISLGEQKAKEIFLGFLTTHYSDKLRRCSRCGRFFLNVSGHRNKQFCTSHCARITSAMRSKEQKHEEKLSQLRRAVRKLPTMVDDPKGWLADKAKVSRHFVTRAINQGLIQLKEEE